MPLAWYQTILIFNTKECVFKNWKYSLIKLHNSLIKLLKELNLMENNLEKKIIKKKQTNKYRI